MRKSAAAFVACILSLFGLFIAFSHLAVQHAAHVQKVRLATFQKETTTVTPIKQSNLTHRADPIAITIPAFGITAPIQPVGLDVDGRMATIPNPKTIAWYAYGATPGSPGNAILAGHRDWNGVLGSFWGIENLQIGDIVQIKFSNKTEMTFQVVSDHSYLAQYVPPQDMSMSGPTRTTLITCVGDFDHATGNYLSRVVVVLKADRHS